MLHGLFVWHCFMVDVIFKDARISGIKWFSYLSLAIDLYYIYFLFISDTAYEANLNLVNVLEVVRLSWRFAIYRHWLPTVKTTTVSVRLRNQYLKMDLWTTTTPLNLLRRCLMWVSEGRDWKGTRGVTREFVSRFWHLLRLISKRIVV